MAITLYCCHTGLVRNCEGLEPMYREIMIGLLVLDNADKSPFADEALPLEWAKRRGKLTIWIVISQ